jgi:hypothetical protein
VDKSCLTGSFFWLIIEEMSIEVAQLVAMGLFQILALPMGLLLLVFIFRKLVIG